MRKLLCACVVLWQLSCCYRAANEANSIQISGCIDVGQWKGRIDGMNRMKEQDQGRIFRTRVGVWQINMLRRKVERVQYEYIRLKDAVYGSARCISDWRAVTD